MSAIPTDPHATPAEIDLSIEADRSFTAHAWVPARPRGAVVFLHGIPSIRRPDPSDEGYRGFARTFAQGGWASVWFDMRGFRSGFFSIEGWVRDAAAVIERVRALSQVDSRPVALVASSAGGAVGAEAVARGADVDALVMLGTPARWDHFADDPISGRRRIELGSGMRLSAASVADLDSWASEFERVTTEHSVQKLTIPILVVHGNADDVVPVGDAPRIAERAARAEVVVLEGAPHQLRRHPGVAELVLDWLDRKLPT